MKILFIRSRSHAHRNEHDMRGHSIVHINYIQNRFPQFEHTVAYMWFDLFGILGGLCGLTFGGSIISVIELIYYGTGRFGAQFSRNICSKRSTARGNNSRNAPPAASIYLNELVQYKIDGLNKRMQQQRYR